MKSDLKKETKKGFDLREFLTPNIFKGKVFSVLLLYILVANLLMHPFFDNISAAYRLVFTLFMFPAFILTLPGFFMLAPLLTGGFEFLAECGYSAVTAYTTADFCNEFVIAFYFSLPFKLLYMYLLSCLIVKYYEKLRKPLLAICGALALLLLLIFCVMLI